MDGNEQAEGPSERVWLFTETKAQEPTPIWTGLDGHPEESRYSRAARPGGVNPENPRTAKAGRAQRLIQACLGRSDALLTGKQPVMSTSDDSSDRSEGFNLRIDMGTLSASVLAAFVIGGISGFWSVSQRTEVNTKDLEGVKEDLRELKQTQKEQQNLLLQILQNTKSR